MRSLTLNSLITLILLTGVTHADQLLMQNGDRLTGTATRKTGDWLTFETNYGGALKIRWADVAELTTDQPVTIMLKDDSLLQTQHFAPREDTQTTATGDVAYINPTPDISGQGIAFTGRINVGINQTSGNTDTQTYHLDSEAIARHKNHRVTLGAAYNEATDSGVQSISNGRLTAQYDRFISPRWYGYANAKLRHDEFKDLKLRRELGIGAGHQFFDSPERKLALEAGLSHVNEDYYSAKDESGVSLRWAANYEQQFYRDLLTLFHNHELTVPLSDTKDFLASAKTGVRIPVADSLAATVEVDVDYDNVPSTGNKRTDLVYLFSLGYSW